ncbi:MAG TPA: hypothetical protein VLC51_10025 [Nitrospira sp.]|nr:hypothetical protein [Nitrospira sp.]
MAAYRGTPIEVVEFNRRDDLYRLLNKDGEIVAELKRHEYLSQPQLRTIRLSNGKHRRPRAAFRGSPSGQSGFPWPSGTVFSWAPGGVTWIGADYPKPAPIEDAGIRAGEVIAYRCWRVVKGDRLHSAYKRKHEWMPGQPMTGDVRHEYGVHAFKEGPHLTEYIEGIRQCDAVPGLYVDFWSGEWVRIEATPVAVGTIALWGEIVEHEFGYRAEFGKIASIDRVIYADDPDLLARLQARYSVSSSVSSKD